MYNQQLNLPLEGPAEVNLNGRIEQGIKYFGIATLHDDGKYRCLADVHGVLCSVEIKLFFEEQSPDES